MKKRTIEGCAAGACKHTSPLPSVLNCCQPHTAMPTDMQQQGMELLSHTPCASQLLCCVDAIARHFNQSGPPLVQHTRTHCKTPHTRQVKLSRRPTSHSRPCPNDDSSHAAKKAPSIGTRVVARFKGKTSSAVIYATPAYRSKRSNLPPISHTWHQSLQ